jgi:hypothetical protein
MDSDYDRIQWLLDEILSYGCVEYNNNGPDWCRYCNGEEAGWKPVKDPTVDSRYYDHTIVHKDGCCYEEACLLRGIEP